ncbi:MAG: orotidine-5'-phosphate decarboxylase [candidate division Zixibacteria bacterium]|nr:orotidine-5'-phosphate decarboxylase [candidate division Zixibacteria bacterium]
MIAVTKLQKAQQTNRSHICLGLDIDPKKMPSANSGSLKGMFDFVHEIIQATSDQVCAYKPNLAFYESHGPDGLALLQLIVERIPENIPIIIDGKRNDIGNTATQYANALFERYLADWVTINPYMGYDSVRPFLDYKDKGVFILCLTSNAGSRDFQLLEVDGKPLYKIVAERVNSWNKDNNCGLVVGATHPEQLREIRAIAGDMPILIPGVGAQGGSLEKAIDAGTDSFHKLGLVNVSRSVLYASNGTDFAEKARQEVIKLNEIVTRVRYGDDKSKEAGQPSVPQTDKQKPMPATNDKSEAAQRTETQSPAPTETNQMPPAAPPERTPDDSDANRPPT